MNRPAARSTCAGVVAVAATYVYFLIFAQYGFLRLLQANLEVPATTEALHAVMAAMGVAGLLASLLAGYWLGRRGARELLRIGFGGAALTAACAPRGTSLAFFVLAGAAIGACTALATVALAADLRRALGGRGFGAKVGLGTGSAYLLCNVPAIFAGPPGRQALVAAVAAGLGMLATLRMGEAVDLPAGRALGPRDARGIGFVTIVAAFLALVWLDSAAFAIVQQTPALKALTWQGTSQKWLFGGIHLVAAIVAGFAIDRGRFRSLLLGTFVAFAVAFELMVRGHHGPFAGGPLYVAGISTYSVALVVYPSYVAAGQGLVPPRWRAALVYGVAGWLGSALGVGMAENLRTIPRPFVAAAGVLLVAGALLAARPDLRLVRRALRAHAITLAFGVAGTLYYVMSGVTGSSGVTVADAEAVERGRDVYVQEGCINCHSQYVRPGTDDVEWWGPYQHDVDRQRPVLIGNRRQGPDLLNAGVRRSAQWHRLHLADPASVSPGSRMPSYAYLFAPDDRRGDDLVAYLGSLGAASADRRYAQIEAWDASHPARSVEHGAALFAGLCAPCHGATGRGDGPVGRVIGRPAMDLHKDAFWLISWGPGTEPEPQALARLVKFGVPGTTMPGHETLADTDVADIVAWVRALRAADVAAAGTASRVPAAGGG